MSKSTQGHIQNVPVLAAMAVLLVVVIAFLMVLLMPAVVVLVDHCMPLATGYQVAYSAKSSS